MTNFTPPRSAEFFAAALVADPELRSAVLGDLSEEYTRMAHASSPRSANRWYWSQLVRSAVPFSTMAVARGGWFGWARLVFATLLSYAFLVLFLGRAIGWLYHTDGARAGTWQLTLAWMATIVVCAAAAGFVAALIAGRSPLAAAVSLGVLSTAVSAYSLIGITFGLGMFSHIGPVPAFYPIAMFIRLSIVFAAVVAGGLIRGGALVRFRAS